MGNQKRYQQWFTQCFLTTPESESLICDLIRYICGVFHPPNSILSSDIVPRWAVIGWLLNLVKVCAFYHNIITLLFINFLSPPFTLLLAPNCNKLNRPIPSKPMQN